MKPPKVFVLATCRKEELLPYTLLVFKTIRVGFPTAEIFVTGNNLPLYAQDEVLKECHSAGCSFSNGPETIHHKWIDNLIFRELDRFYILDTDVIFYENFERFSFEGSAIAGFRVPEFSDEFSGAITRSRLHTSLLYIDPKIVSEKINAYASNFPDTPFNPLANLIYPLCLPLNGKAYFYDTCSMLYHAIGGTAFTDEHMGCYFHFFFGTISDIVIPRLEP